MLINIYIVIHHFIVFLAFFIQLFKSEVVQFHLHSHLTTIIITLNVSHPQTKHAQLFSIQIFIILYLLYLLLVLILVHINIILFFVYIIPPLI